MRYLRKDIEERNRQGSAIRTVLGAFADLLRRGLAAGAGRAPSAAGVSGLSAAGASHTPLVLPVIHSPGSASVLPAAPLLPPRNNQSRTTPNPLSWKPAAVSSSAKCPGAAGRQSLKGALQILQHVLGKAEESH